MPVVCFLQDKTLDVVSHTFPSASTPEGDHSGRRAGMCGVTSHNVTHDVTGSAGRPQS